MAEEIKTDNLTARTVELNARVRLAGSAAAIADIESRRANTLLYWAKEDYINHLSNKPKADNVESQE